MSDIAKETIAYLDSQVGAGKRVMSASSKPEVFAPFVERYAHAAACVRFVEALDGFITSEDVSDEKIDAAPNANHKAWLTGKAEFIAKMRLCFPVLLRSHIARARATTPEGAPDGN